MAGTFSHRDPFGMGDMSEVMEQAGRKAREYAEAEIKKQTAELRAELAVQQAIVAELARRLALKQLPPEA